MHGLIHLTAQRDGTHVTYVTDATRGFLNARDTTEPDDTVVTPGSQQPW